MLVLLVASIFLLRLILRCIQINLGGDVTYQVEINYK